MSYVKWTSNLIPGDGTSRVILKDGSVVQRGVPVDLSAEDKKTLEGMGLVLESSSAEEAKSVSEAVQQAPGGDVSGSAPVFADTQGAFNQNADDSVDQPSSGGGSKKS